MAEHDAPLSEERAQKRMDLVMTDVTLNGEPARISGIRNRFATVTQKRSGLSCEFSWEAVERIIANGGRFQS